MFSFSCTLDLWNWISLESLPLSTATTPLDTIHAMVDSYCAGVNFSEETCTHLG